MHEKQKRRLKHVKQYETVRGPFVLQTGEPDELPLNLVKVYFLTVLIHRWFVSI